MAKVKMTPEAKERLRQAAQAKKGRDTLSALDHTLGLVAFDHVQDRDGELPKIEVQGRGRIEVNGVWIGNLKKWWRWDGESKTFTTAKWVRLERAPEWISEEFRRRWGAKRIQYQAYAGPLQGSVWKAGWVVPVPQAVAWFQFLWPTEEECRKRLCKYLVGYTDLWIERYEIN